MTQHIRLEEVKAACRLAYAENRLIAQHEADKYGYHVGGHCCAIGAALTYDTGEELRTSGYDTFTLSDESWKLEEVFTWRARELEDLRAIQSAHDNWKLPLTYGTDDTSEQVKEKAKALFLRLIEYDGYP